jgi:hypothetical protein
MSVGKFLVAWMRADADVTAILGTSPLRFWPGTVPQAYRETFPRAVYQQLGGSDFSMELSRGGDVWEAEFQISLIGRGKGGYDDVQGLKAAIMGSRSDPKLHYYSGTLASIEIAKAVCGNEIDNATPPDEASDNTIHEVHLDFTFWYVRS